MNGRFVKGVLLLALAYFAAARLSLLFAIPPGYSTAAWPPAGIALAALWVWGIELWPGVFLGSFAANAVTVWSRGPVGSAPVLLAAWIGAGAAAQALTAAVVAHRAVGGRDPLARERDLFRFLIIGGPVSCVIASLWGTGGMLLLKTIAPPEALYSWVTWWVGDAVGVAFAAPLILLWAGRGPADSQRRKIAVTAVLFAVVATVFGIHHHAISTDKIVLLTRAKEGLADVSTSLRTALSEGVDAVSDSADFAESLPGFGRAEFGRFARASLLRHPAMLALQWRPRTRGDFPILFAETARGAETILGFDVAEKKSVSDALALALRTGKPEISGEIRLPGKTRDEMGVVILVPARSPGAAGAAGVMVGIYRVRDTMEDLLASSDPEVRDFRVEDVTDPAAPRLLDSKGDFPLDPAGSISTTADIGGRRWRVELTPAANFGKAGRSEQSWLVLARALAVMYLTSWVLLTLYGRAERISALVEARTAELREQERRLMRAQKMESVGQLAGGIAHEFNNILMGASGLAQLLLLSLGPRHPSTPDVEGIVASIKRASHLVSQLLTYSRRRETRIKAIDLNGLIQGLAGMTAAALGKRIRMEFGVGVEPLWIEADASQVEQTLLNLCFNARDAMSGKGTIRIATRPVAAAGELAEAFIPAPPGRYAVMEVSDDGPGIPEDVLPHLAEPFFTTKPFGEGTGLGLSVVSGIVRQHKGGMIIRTAPGAGASMQIYWPAAYAPLETTPAPRAAAPHGSGLILIVDDEPLVCSTLERILSGFGYATVSAGGGEEALRVLQGAPEVRGVVLDLLMPGMDGLETYDRMLALRPGLKVLFLSGYAPRESEEKMKLRGLPFLGKPADPSQLAVALDEVLSAPPRA
jgi:signal transduction histidine kinase/CheY-like chemotaxis protein